MHCWPALSGAVSFRRHFWLFLVQRLTQQLCGTFYLCRVACKATQVYSKVPVMWREWTCP